MSAFGWLLELVFKSPSYLLKAVFTDQMIFHMLFFDKKVPYLSSRSVLLFDFSPRIMGWQAPTVSPLRSIIEESIFNLGSRAHLAVCLPGMP